MNRLTCREFIEFLQAYYDNELSDAVHTSFQTHLGACKGCHEYLRTYGETIRMVQSVGDEPCKDEVAPPSEELIDAILKARRADQD